MDFFASEDRGMDRTPTHHRLLVKGMSCQHCVRAVTQAVQDKDPQAEVSIDLTQGQVSVNTTLALAPLLQAIVDEGYEARPAPN
jgi:copper chaperone